MEDFPERQRPLKNLPRIAWPDGTFQEKLVPYAGDERILFHRQVLPALVPEMSYDELDIAGGGQAMAAFEGLAAGHDQAERKDRGRGLLLRNGYIGHVVKIVEKTFEI